MEVTKINSVVTSPQATVGNFTYKGPDTYSLELFGFGGPDFTPSTRKASSDQFDRYRIASETTYAVANLDLAKKSGGLTFTYSSFGNVVLANDGKAPSRLDYTFFAVGSLTPVDQMPKTGSATYTGTADGLWIDGAVTRRLYGSTAKLTANFATGDLTSVLDLRGHDDAFGAFATAPTTALGTFTGAGRITNAAFRGDFPATAGYSGTFSGQFFGPAAQEAGLAFALKGAAGQTAFGAALASR